MQTLYWIEVFKAGEQTDSSGNTRLYTREDLENIASNYDPAAYEAPLTIGHVTGSAPAYGWIKGLKVVGDSLYALVEPTPNAIELVRDGHYKQVSCGFYDPESPHNPTPGNWYLDHIALLGAVAPAVRGLKRLEFNAISFYSTITPDQIGAQKQPRVKEILDHLATANAELAQEIEQTEEALAALENPVTVLAPIYGGEHDPLSYISTVGVVENLIEGPLVLANGKHTLYDGKYLGGAEVVDIFVGDNYSIIYLTEDPIIRGAYEETPMESEPPDEYQELREKYEKLKQELARRDLQKVYERGVLTEGVYPLEKLLTLYNSLEEKTVNFSSGPCSAQEALMDLLNRLTPVVPMTEFASNHAAKKSAKLPKLPPNSRYSEQALSLYEQAVEIAEREGITFSAAINKLIQGGTNVKS